MNLTEAAHLLTLELTKEKPKTFTGTWVYAHTPRVYRFVRLNLRTCTGEIDWDVLTKRLEPEFAKRWTGQRRRGRLYESSDEVEQTLARYRTRLYIFLAPQDRRDENLRDRISIRLIRLAQRGNLTAKQEIATLIRYVVDDWVERYPMLSRWKYNSEQLDAQIAGCMHRYRFTGSFLGYLYKTLLYSGRGLRPVYSLDEPMWRDSGVTRSEYVVQDPETGEIKMYEKGTFSSI